MNLCLLKFTKQQKLEISVALETILLNFSRNLDVNSKGTVKENFCAK